MTKRKLTELVELSTADDADLIHILDVSEPVVTNQNKKITVQNLLDGLGGGDEPYVEIGYTGVEPTAASNSIAIGQNIQTFSNTIAIGRDIPQASSTFLHHIGIGSGIDFGGDGGAGNIIIGAGAGSGAADEQIVIGHNAFGGDLGGAVVIGQSASADGNDSVTIGRNCSTNNNTEIAIGNNISIGDGDTVAAVGGIAIGSTAGLASTNDATNSIAIGTSTLVNSLAGVCIGNNADIAANSPDAIAIGTSAQVGNNDANAIAIGNNPSAFSADTIAMGNNTSVSGGADSIGIGARNTVVGPSQYVVGTDNTLDAGTATVYAFSSGNQSFGEQNVIRDCRQVFIFGQQNTATGLADNVIIGEDNVLTGGQNVAATDSNMFNNIQLGNQNSIIDTVQADTQGGRIQIGRANLCNATNSRQSIQIGELTIVRDNCANAIAIGTNAEIGTGAEGAVQIGIGTNSEINTLKFRSTKIADSSGIMVPLDAGVPSVILDDGHIRIDNTNDALYFRSGGAWVQAGGGGGGGEPYVEINSTGAVPTANGANSISLGQEANGNGTRAISIGLDASIGTIYDDGIAIGTASRIFGNNAVSIGNATNVQGAGSIGIGPGADANASNQVIIGTSAAGGSNVNSIAIGNSASCSSGSGIAIGPNSSTDGASSAAVAIGSGAISNATAAIQLGAGTNTNINSLQFRAEGIATDDGIRAKTWAGTPTVTAVDGTLAVDVNNDKFYFRSNSTWYQAEQVIRASESTSGTNVAVAVNNPRRQFISPTANIDVTMPASPDNTTWFMIANDDVASGFNLTVKDNGGTTLLVLGNAGPANHAEFIYTGSNWRVLY